MKREYTIEDFFKITVPAIFVMIAILAFYNVSLHINHTGSGKPDIIMRKLGLFFSTGEGEETATAADTTAVDTATENTQEAEGSTEDANTSDDEQDAD